jgi:hypothetical protein
MGFVIGLLAFMLAWAFVKLITYLGAIRQMAAETVQLQTKVEQLQRELEATKNKQIMAEIQKLMLELRYNKLAHDYHMLEIRAQMLQNGHSGKSPPGTFNKELVSRMIRLCHPDKHGNSPASTEVTQILLKIRDTI